MDVSVLDSFAEASIGDVATLLGLPFFSPKSQLIRPNLSGFEIVVQMNRLLMIA